MGHKVPCESNVYTIYEKRHHFNPGFAKHSDHLKSRRFLHAQTIEIKTLLWTRRLFPRVALIRRGFGEKTGTDKYDKMLTVASMVLDCDLRRWTLAYIARRAYLSSH